MFYSKKLRTFREINHCFFSKKRGFSKGLYKSLNCGTGSFDNKKDVKKNLSYVSRKLKIKKKLVLMYQTHSNKVTEVKKSNLMKKKIYCDAMITKLKGVGLGVVTADCVPILLYESKKKTIGCIHAGWKGAISGIIKNTVLKLKKSNPKNKIYATVGPCIGKKSYEVDLDFTKKFLSKSSGNKKYFSKKNKFKRLFDLRKFVSDELIKFDVIIDHINLDTFREKNTFFSYRRSCLLGHEDYGRCISIISLS